jgi:hypothetical protein
MKRGVTLLLCAAGTLLAGAPPALPCSLCFSVAQSPTLRQSADGASLVVFGTITKQELTAGGKGASELQVEAVLKPHAYLDKKKSIQIPRYIPGDARNPPRFLVFCDVVKDNLDPFRGVPVKSAAVAEYLKGAIALNPKDPAQALLYFFRYLEHPDKDVAQDAFLEFAKASDKEVGQIAGKLSAEKLRGWLKDPQTPAERLSLYAFLLGACGGEPDVAFLRSLLQETGDRVVTAYDGILSGYIQLRPKEGWNLAVEILRDGQKPFAVRFAVVRMMRFYQGWKPEETRPQVVRGLEAVLAQGELADMAVEDLRRWEIWDLTDSVLAQFGKKVSDGPIVRRAIVRYALSCPKPEAKRFLDELRQKDGEMVREVEESLKATSR